MPAPKSLRYEFTSPASLSLPSAQWVAGGMSSAPSTPFRRGRRGWVWLGIVLAAVGFGSFAGVSGALLLGGLVALLVALAVLISPRWVGARGRAVAGVIAAIGLAGTICGTALAGTAPSSSEPRAVTTGSPSTATATPTPSASQSPTPEPAESTTPDAPSTTAESTAAVPSPTAKTKVGTALAAAEQLTVKGRAPRTGYDRSAYGDGWRRVDGCSTREIILRRDLGKVTVVDEDDCGVVRGTLHDPYTGTIERLDAGSLSTAEIDHV